MDSPQTLAASGADTLVLGRYRLHERLGAGGFGVVWRATDEQLRREVAVKRIWLNPHEQSAERAEREAQASARLSHPAIVALYEARLEGEAFYLISELVRGETLGALLAEGELGDEEVLAIGMALADALEHAHGRGVIHRDVKPHNILVPDDPDEGAGGVAKLTDFGGALLAGEDVLTRTGDVLGTLAYMAPEQCEGREAVTQTDLYSLALVLYEALSGVNPVRGSNPADTARRIGGRLPPLRRYRRDLPRGLAATLDGALAADPRRRGTLRELHEALGEALAGGLEETERVRGEGPEVTRTRHRPIVLGPPGLATPRVPGPAKSHSPGLAIPHHPGPASPHAPGLAPPYAPGLAPPHAHREPRHRDSPRLPRAVWLLAAVGLAIWQASAGRPGLALLTLAALAPLLLARRTPVQALAGVLAPALGTIGLAGVLPAVAAQAGAWRVRAAAGALGYWWLCLAEPLLGRHLWLGPAAATTGYPGGRVAWEGSPQGAFDHVLVPLLGTGVLLGAALWALAAMALPWLVRGRHVLLDLVAATMWSAALLTAEPLLDHGLPLTQGQSLPRGALPAALLAGALAVAARALRGPV